MRGPSLLAGARRPLDGRGQFRQGTGPFLQFRPCAAAAVPPRDDPRQDHTGFAGSGPLSPHFGRAARTGAARSRGNAPPCSATSLSCSATSRAAPTPRSAPSCIAGALPASSRARRATKSKRSPISSPMRDGSRRAISRRRPEPESRPTAKKGRSKERPFAVLALIQVFLIIPDQSVETRTRATPELAHAQHVRRAL